MRHVDRRGMGALFDLEHCKMRAVKPKRTAASAFSGMPEMRRISEITSQFLQECSCHSARSGRHNGVG